MFGNEFCDCRCHDTSSGIRVRHIVACCGTCSVCQSKVRISHLADHEGKCQAGLEILIDSLKDEE